MKGTQPATAPAAGAASRRRHEQAAQGDVSVAGHLRGTSLNRALDVIGDWWTQRILREAFLGVRNFDEFQSHLGIPRQTLTLRLKALVGHGIFDTSRGGYRLTPRGLALYPWALMVWRWSRLWGGKAGPSHPPRLVHHVCGHVMEPVFACGACHQEVTLRDIDYEALPTRRTATATATATETATAGSLPRRWTGGKVVLDAGQASHHIALITADRWTHLIVSAVFLGCRTFDRLRDEIGISTNVLSQRLALLVEAGLLGKTRSEDDARRFDYRLTPRSRDVFPLTITLVQWADGHLPSAGGPPLLRYHRACGQRFHASVTCSHCSGELEPHRVSFQPPAPAGAKPETRSPT